MTSNDLIGAIAETIHADRHPDRAGAVGSGVCDCIARARWITFDLPRDRRPDHDELARAIHLRSTHAAGSVCEGGPGTIDRELASQVLAALA